MHPFNEVITSWCQNITMLPWKLPVLLFAVVFSPVVLSKAVLHPFSHFPSLGHPSAPLLSLYSTAPSPSLHRLPALPHSDEAHKQAISVSSEEKGMEGWGGPPVFIFRHWDTAGMMWW